VRHIVGRLSHNCLGQGDLVLASRATHLGSALAQCVLEISSVVHCDAASQRTEKWHTLKAAFPPVASSCS
jgi:hypothetical protein